MNILDKCPVPHLQESWEFNKLAEIYTTLAPAKVIEIGSFYGATLWYWITGSKNIQRVTSVDYPIGPADGRYNEMIQSRAQWSGWAEESRVCLYDIQGDSHARATVERVAQIYPDNDVDFLFIDGDHSYRGVRADYLNYSQFVRPGGLIVFHDIIGLPDVSKFWRELKSASRCMEIFGGAGGWGIGIIEKQ
jgi:cephalosporin hydroxylase